MPINVFCPFCRDFVPMNILKTENLKTEYIWEHEAIHYNLCARCENIWLTHDEWEDADVREAYRPSGETVK